MPILPDQEISPKLMPGDAAKRLGVTTKTLAAMPNLHPIVLPSGHRRYLASEIERVTETAAPSSHEADGSAAA